MKYTLLNTLMTGLLFLPFMAHSSAQVEKLKPSPHTPLPRHIAQRLSVLAKITRKESQVWQSIEMLEKEKTHLLDTRYYSARKLHREAKLDEKKLRSLQGKERQELQRMLEQRPPGRPETAQSFKRLLSAQKTEREKLRRSAQQKREEALDSINTALNQVDQDLHDKQPTIWQKSMLRVDTNSYELLSQLCERFADDVRKAKRQRHQ